MFPNRRDNYSALSAVISRISVIRDVTELRVYKQSLDLLRPIYKLVSTIPLSHDRLRRQILASAEGIPAQIAEGFAKRRSSKEFLRYLEIAMGSSDETITHLQVILILSESEKFVDKPLYLKLIEDYRYVSKQINLLRNNWKSH